MSKAKATRLDILQKAFQLIYTNGYQTTSIDEIIDTTKVTKGAFYYHFSSKDEMGLAIVRELLQPAMQQGFIEPLQNSTDPQKDIYNMMKHLLFGNAFLQAEYGCPAGNLTHEMAAHHEDFNTALSALVLELRKAIEHCINNGKKNGKVRKGVHAGQVTLFIMSAYWGIRNIGKLHDSKAAYTAYLAELKNYLKSLA